MEKIKKDKSENHTIRKLDDHEVFNQVNIQGMNESLNIVTNDKSQSINALLDKALTIFLKIRSDNQQNEEYQ